MHDRATIQAGRRQTVPIGTTMPLPSGPKAAFKNWYLIIALQVIKFFFYLLKAFIYNVFFSRFM